MAKTLIKLSLPSVNECKPGPEMRGYIHKVILGVPQKENFNTHDYVVIDNEPIWLNENKTSVTCPNYPGDIRAAFQMMNDLSDIQPELFITTGSRINMKFGIHGLFSMKPVKVAEIICTTLVAVVQEMSGKN